VPVTDVIIDEVVANVRAVDSASLLDPKLVRRLVHAVLTGADERKAREKRRRDDARIGDDAADDPGAKSSEW
jgi:hypothetical protein